MLLEYALVGIGRRLRGVGRLYDEYLLCMLRKREVQDYRHGAAEIQDATRDDHGPADDRGDALVLAAEYHVEHRYHHDDAHRYDDVFARGIGTFLDEPDRTGCSRHGHDDAQERYVVFEIARGHGERPAEHSGHDEDEIHLDDADYRPERLLLLFFLHAHAIRI